MGKSRKKGKKGMKIAIYILLFTWIVLLAVLAAIYLLRKQGYENFNEWRGHQTQEVFQQNVVIEGPTEPLAPIVTVTPTIAPTATPTPSPTPTPTPSPTPTAIPQAIEVMGDILTEEAIFSGNETVDAAIREQVETLSGEEEIRYVGYQKGIYFSTVFQKGAELFPTVYNLETGVPVTGSDLMKEIYFAIIKERLQTYVAEEFPDQTGDEFLTYQQIYQAEDYQQFYMTEDKLVFYFSANTLTAEHPAFTYEADLSEAQAFFKYDFDGIARTPYIRELDPNAKMLAITFDDGPYPKVENQILELFEKYNGRTTFFFLGDRAEDWFPKSATEVYAAGHEVASHTYSHELNFASASEEEMWTEVNRTNLVLAKATGYAPDYIRYPGGSYGKKSLNVPMYIINWNYDSIDYKEKKKSDGADIIYDRLINSNNLKDGSILLVHSIYQNTYDAIERFVEYVTAEGYELVTLSEMYYYKGVDLQYGYVYSDGNGKKTTKK